MSFDLDGKFIVCWEQKDNGLSRIYTQKFLANGNRFGSTLRISTEPDTFDHYFPQLILFNDKIYTIWQSNGHIWANISDFYRDSDEPLPTEIHLFQNFPNPFNESTIIKFSLTKPMFIQLDIYNLLGEKIIVLAKRVFEAGTHFVEWDGKDLDKENLPSGIYFCSFKGENFTKTIKMVLTH